MVAQTQKTFIMKTILLDKFTNSIAVTCSNKKCIIDYFNTLEDAIEAYPKATVCPSLNDMEITIDKNVYIKLINQQITLTKEQAITLRNSLNYL